MYSFFGHPLIGWQLCSENGASKLFMSHLSTFNQSGPDDQIANRNLFSIGGGGSSGKSKGGEEVADGEVLVDGEDTSGEGGTGTFNHVL